MKIFALVLCLVPSIVFGATQLNFKDGSTVCGEYAESGKAYCKNMIGGDVCFDKSGLTSVRQVSECGEAEIGDQGKGTEYLKKTAKTPLDFSVAGTQKEKKAPAYK